MSFRYDVTVMILLRTEDTNTNALSFRYDYLKLIIEIHKPSYIAKLVIMSFRCFVITSLLFNSEVKKDYIYSTACEV